MRELVDDAVARGATLHCGGPRDDAWFAPAVLTGVPADAPLLREEVPGPVLAVDAVDDVDEAIAPRQRGRRSASARRCGPPTARAGARIARALHAGMVWMNDHQVAAMAPQLPWGGVKDSGLGPHARRGRAARVRRSTRS